jgi:branched-subunit amino acid ABC-type transport system permease component
MAVGIPTWLVLLLVFPEALGFGPLPSLILATLLAIGFTEAVERLILRPLIARRRRTARDDTVGRAGRALVIGLGAWALIVWPFVVNDIGNVWVAWLVPMALALVVVEIVERLVVRPLQRRREARR